MSLRDVTFLARIVATPMKRYLAITFVLVTSGFACFAMRDRASTAPPNARSCETHENCFAAARCLVIRHSLCTVVHEDEIFVLEAGTVVVRGAHEAAWIRRWATP